jgi:threonylcarbamoyladenosine tRNA methylthiotransferase MtaB
MRIAIKTLGCKSNRYESDRLFDILSQNHEVFEINEGANTFERKFAYSDIDVLIVNTCTVTHVADRKSRQAIRSFSSINPECKIIVFGCGSNVSPNEYKEMEEIFKIVRSADEIPKIIDQLEDKNPSKCEYIGSFANGIRTRALLKIQDGCNNYCSYCIIPRARGPEVSFPSEKILKEAIEKEKAGFNEVILTGIILSNWNENGKDFSDLVELLLKNTSKIRFRISSMEPSQYPDKFFNLFKSERVCPHIHMSLQSGSDSVLKRMRRHYDLETYREALNNLRKVAANIGLTTDVIVGFPGETDSEFDETCKFVEESGFSKVHVFPYSRRKDTAAYYMKDQIDEVIKKRRAAKLAKIGEKSKIEFWKKQIGNEYEIIVERVIGGPEFENVEVVCQGVTPNYIPVQFICSQKCKRGDVFKIRLIEVFESYIFGVVL